MTQSLVVGVDAGATSTRVAVHRLDGTRVGYAQAGAGNPTAHGTREAVAAVEQALVGALGELAGSRVVASMAGVAGHVDEMVPALAEVWAAHGIAAPPRYTDDVLIGYAAGTPEPDGSLLLSGTGAVAGRIVDFELDAVADGLGWLLADEGSGFWIGRRAVKGLIAALDRGLPAPSNDRLDRDLPAPHNGRGVLAESIVAHFLGDKRPGSPRETALRIVRQAQAAPVRLAEVAALVNRAAEAGDPAALKITDEAAGALVAMLRRVQAAGPVVLAGSVLTSEGPVRRAVIELLAAERVSTAADAAGAAAWLAARPLLSEADAAACHAAFTAGT
ncbi:BadF/BadG/BcrA/BcrD ATPase family protein [Nonomuraea sp. NPDC050404]|uniref:N-acetylglucosamine kinase n=1 Tax=Nonomuraea sp. NPDC050404 TaxID=3155783 RepID=UPI0033C6C425